MPYLKSPLFVAGLVLVVIPLFSMTLTPHVELLSLPEYEFSMTMELPTFSLSLMTAGTVVIATSVITGRQDRRR